MTANERRPHVMILGAGLAGVTSAWALRRRGCDVTVIDKRSQSALETSFANGGQLSFSHVEPWANPALLRRLPVLLGGKHSPVRFHWRAEWALWRWCVQFLWACRASASQETARKLWQLARYSKTCFAEFRHELSIDFDHAATGTLHLYRTARELDAAQQLAMLHRDWGIENHTLDVDETVAREPVLARSKEVFAGSIYHPLDESGDACRFTQAIAEWLVSEGVTFYYDTALTGIKRRDGMIAAIETSEGIMGADAYVLAFGPRSPQAMRLLGMQLPLYPMKGYSLTVPCSDRSGPHHAITDNARKIVYSRLGNRLRAAGMADIGGQRNGVDMRRALQLQDHVLTLFPRLKKADRADFWSGLRPATPYGAPVIGSSQLENLYVNTGHGTLGWTLSLGSACVIADAVLGKPPAIDINYFAP